MSSTDIRTYWLLCFCAAGLTLPLDVEAGLPALVPTEEHLTLQGDLTSGFFPPRQSASSVKVIGVTIDGLGVLQGPSEDAQNEAISDWTQADNASSYLDFEGDYWYTIDPTRNPSLHPEAHWLPLEVTIDYTGTGDVVWNNVVTTPIVWIPDCFAAN